jgi:hypothetical protein
MTKQCRTCYYWLMREEQTYWGSCTNDVVSNNVVSAEDIEFSFEFSCYKWQFYSPATQAG